MEFYFQFGSYCYGGKFGEFYLYSKKIRTIGLQPQTLNADGTFSAYGKMERMEFTYFFGGFLYL